VKKVVQVNSDFISRIALAAVPRRFFVGRSRLKVSLDQHR